MRIIVFGGLDWGPLILGNYHVAVVCILGSLGVGACTASIVRSCKQHQG